MLLVEIVGVEFFTPLLVTLVETDERDVELAVDGVVGLGVEPPIGRFVTLVPVLDAVVEEATFPDNPESPFESEGRFCCCCCCCCACSC